MFGIPKAIDGLDIMEVIRNRVSVRSYADDPVEDSIRRELDHDLGSVGSGPFGTRPRFQMVDFKPLGHKPNLRLGTYGFIKGANLFILGAVKDEAGALEDLGFCLEKIILKATWLRLGTCWLGAFQSGAFAAHMNLADHEQLSAITPDGYPAKDIPAPERLVHFSAGSKKRKPWAKLFFEADGKTSLSEKEAREYRDPLEAVRMGPSAANRQPWRLIREDRHSFHLYLNENKIFNRAIGKVRLQNIDCGIAMCHFDLVARERGLTGSWKTGLSGPILPGLQYIATWSR